MVLTLPSKATFLKVGRGGLYAFNTVMYVFVLWIVAVNLGGFPYRLGIDGQKVRCLPWSVFIVKTEVPKVIMSGDLVQYRTGKVGHGFDGLIAVKMVGAIPGDKVEIRNDSLFINGQARGRLWLIKSLQAKPGQFDRSFVVPSGEYVMLGTSRESFDSRYWGTVKQEQLLGTAIPIF